MLHVVESFGQLGHFRLTGRRQVGRVELAPGDLPGGADHLLHRGQQRQHREGHDAAQRKAERHHDGLRPFDPVAEGRHGGVSSLSVGDGRVQQLLGVLAQIADAGYDLIIVELGGFRVLTGGYRFFQLVHQCGVAVVGSGNGIVEQILLLTHSAKVALDAPEPCVGDGKGAVELLCQRFGVAVLPAVIFHGRKAPLHAVLEAADGVEVAHLVVQFPQHGAGLVKAQEYLPRQRQKKCRQAKTDLPLQGHPAPHAPILPFCDILPRIFRLIRPVRRQSERSINFLFRPILAHFRASAQYHP